MIKAKSLKFVSTIALIALVFSLLIPKSYAQTVTTPTADTTPTTTTTKQNVTFTIEIETGTQSAWDNSVPLTVKFLPSADVSQTEVSWDVPDGVKLATDYTNYFTVSKDQVYTVNATLYPSVAGTYDIAANITAWRVGTNEASSKKITLSFDKDLLVTPTQAGYSFAVILKYVVIVIGGIAGIFVIVFLAKIGLKKLGKWLKPPEF
jgi:hypothetical protein